MAWCCQQTLSSPCHTSSPFHAGGLETLDETPSGELTDASPRTATDASRHNSIDVLRQPSIAEEPHEVCNTLLTRQIALLRHINVVKGWMGVLLGLPCFCYACTQSETGCGTF